MQATPETLQLLSTTLTATVSPDSSTRKQAEEQLRNGEAQPGFLLLILELVRSDGVDMVVRQAAGVYFKNATKRLWEPEEVSREVLGVPSTDNQGGPSVINEGDKDRIKALLVPTMIHLARPQTTLLQAQIGEGLASVASHDFPDQWDSLVDVS